MSVTEIGTTGAKSRYRGAELSAAELPRLLNAVSTEIDQAWGEEYQRLSAAPVSGRDLNAANYRRAGRVVTDLAADVRAVALDWALSETDDQRRAVGRNVLLHQALPSTLRSIARVKRDYPGAILDEEHLIEKGL